MPPQKPHSILDHSGCEHANKVMHNAAPAPDAWGPVPASAHPHSSTPAQAHVPCHSALHLQKHKFKGKGINNVLTATAEH